MIVPVLAVKDVDASIAFYKNKLGFVERLALPGPDGVTAFGTVQLNGSDIMLSRDEQLDNRGHGVVLMVYVSDDTDIDKLYQSVQEKGVSIEQELKTEYWGDRVFSVRDIDGYFITITKTVEEADMEHVEKVMRGESERD